MSPSQSTHSPSIESIRSAVLGDAAGWRGRSLLTMADVSAAQIDTALDLAADLKAMHRNAGSGRELIWRYPRTLAMLFEKPSLRTRVSFEAGMAQLGGHAINLGTADVGLGTREPVADVAAALSRWVDAIAARVHRHEVVDRIAAVAAVPVVNALSDVEHPCQAFADLLTIREQKGDFRGLRLAYVGDGNNVLHSLMLACARVGIHVNAACPEGYGPDPSIVDRAVRLGTDSGATVSIVNDPCAAAAGADILYTDVWASMGQEEEQETRRAAFRTYCIDDRLLAVADRHAIVLHCLPAHRGEEIGDSVMARFHSVILDQAENRLHTQKALLALMLGI